MELMISQKRKSDPRFCNFLRKIIEMQSSSFLSRKWILSKVKESKQNVEMKEYNNKVQCHIMSK